MRRKWTVIPMPNRGKAATRSWIRRLVPLALAPAVLAGCDSDLTDLGRSRTVRIRVQGTVTAASDGRALAGTTVERQRLGELDPERPKGITDSLGRYSFTTERRCESFCSLEPILFFLVAHLDGFNRGFEPRGRAGVEPWEHREVRDSVLFDGTLNFALRPTRPITVSVRGRVTNGSTGEPRAVMVTVAAELQWAFSFTPLFDIPQASAETNTEGSYVVVSSQFCAISGSSCFVSFRVTARKGDQSERRIFDNVNVADDSLSLTVNFDTFR